MTTRPKTRKAPSRAIDPVFAAIAEHKARAKEWGRLSSKLDNAQLQAAKTHGHRPWELIAWRNYPATGGRELDDRREEFLRQPGADRKQVEKEYRDAKAREVAAERAAVEWDHRVGIAPLREQYERANAAERRAAMRMARTKPMTPAGAAALVAYIRRDIMVDAPLVRTGQWSHSRRRPAHLPEWGPHDAAHRYRLLEASRALLALAAAAAFRLGVSGARTMKMSCGPRR
jgi:hypothetical protein